MRVYAIGDIHGQLAQLEAALALIEADGGEADPVVFVGDYVDRGLAANGVIARLMAGQSEGRPWTALKGNHDRMFLRFVRDGVLHDARILSGKSWLHPALGGTATLSSYFDLAAFEAEAGITREDMARFGAAPDLDSALARLSAQARAAVPDAHLAFIAALPTTHAVGELLFVHAGLRPGVALAEQDEDDLVWIRDGWLDDARDHGPLVVHGHTALDFPRHHGNRLNLDAGAGYGRPLVPVVIEGRTAWALGPDGRRPLMPGG